MGHLSAEQQVALQPFIEDQVVFDFGAGDCRLTQILVEMGTRLVVAMDKQLPRQELPGILKLRGDFREVVYKTMPFLLSPTALNFQFPEIIDVGFVSWPSNHYNPMLLNLMFRSKILIYLGKNTDMSACGVPRYFGYLRSREVLVYVPHSKNCLIIYGEHLDEPRSTQEMYGEEIAGLLSYDREFTYRESEEIFS